MHLSQSHPEIVFFFFFTEACVFSATSLESLKLGESFTLSNANTMNSMFMLCNALNSIDTSKFDTKNVKDMESTFQDCQSLTSLDLSSFDTSQVTSMRYMFAKCYKLTTLNIASFDTQKCEKFDQIFDGITKLEITVNQNKCSNILTNLPSGVTYKNVG